jgi:NAD(P)-dependent dehydrogenase (short-subunit alcohol dehydrogenase family)
MVRRQAHQDALIVAGDVADPTVAAQMVNAALDRFGRLDAAANCAAIIRPRKSIFDMTVEEFDEVLNINLRGLWLSVKHEMAAMRAEGGAIVNVSSANAVRSAELAYSASKAGVEGLTRAAAAEGGSLGIRVNALCSGAIWTPMLDAANGAGGRRETLEAAFRQHIPLGRIGEPAEAAAAIVWLCSPAASYVTGTCVEVDGGLLAI